MTIKRSTRSLRPTGRGRPRKLRTPPKSISDLIVVLDLFTPNNLRDLAEATELTILDDDLVEMVCIGINQAFSEYANATSIQVNNSPAGERRDWCASVTAAAADLHKALGHTGDSLFFEKPAFEAEETLKRGWPSDPKTDESSLLREELTRAFSFAMPDKYALSRGERRPQEIDGDLLSLLERLGPALRALTLVARSAEDSWKAELAQSRNSREDGRRHLMNVLVTAFGCLFGRAPTSRPGSAGFRWLSALITQAGQTASEQRRAHPSDGTQEDRERIAALEAVEAIAAHIAPQPIETRGTAKLSHWLREALASPDIQRARAEAEAILSKM